MHRPGESEVSRVTVLIPAFRSIAAHGPANEFIKDCRLGQTERGRFVVTIITPVPPSLRQAALPGDGAFDEVLEPSARRVDTRLMGSLEIVDDAARNARLDPILGGHRGRGEREPVRRHGRDATRRGPVAVGHLHELVAEPASHPAHVPKAVTFARADFEIIKEAGRLLRERATSRSERFEGRIHPLHSDLPSLFDDLIGKIVILTTVGGQPARVKVVLGRDDSRRA